MSLRIRTGAWIAACALLVGTPQLAWAQDETGADQDRVTQDADDADAQALEETRQVEVDEPDDLDDIENLVVTARRRPEFLQETPVAATVLGGELLEQRGVDSLEDAAIYVPNLSGFSGVQHQGTFYSRGVGQRDAIVTLDPGVGIYVDDVYVARAHGALLPTVDVERLEVLRGPQGTLYGKNTIGGAIKLISQKPGPIPYISGAIGGGEYETINGSATVNAPIIDNLLYSRFTFAGKDSEGYNQNRVNDKWVNDENLKAVRAQFRLLPQAYVTLDLSGHYSTQREGARGARCHVSNPALGVLNPGFIGVIQTACESIDSETTYEFASDQNDHYFLDTYGTSLVADWEVGPILGIFDSFDLKNVAAWQQQKVDDGYLDLDATGLGFPFQIHQRTIEEQRQTQWSEELQASAGIGDLLRLTAGVYAFWEDTNRGDLLANNAVSQRVERTEIENSSYAVYGQGSITPLEWMEITGGVRGTWETKSAKRTIVSNGFPPAGELPVEHASEDYSQVTPMGGIAFKAPDSLLTDLPVGSALLYFTYSQGYKSGGFATRRDPSVSGIPDFKPEELDNYEVGLKFDFFDSRVILNSAFFYSEYEDIQLTVARAALNNPAPFTPDIGSSIDNAGKGTIKGFEIELITRPFDVLVLRGSVGITDAEYDEFDDLTFVVGNATTTAVPLDRSDEDFYNIPELSVQGSAEWPFSLGALGVLTPLVNVYYQTATNTHFTAEGFASGDFRQDAYTLLDLRLIYDLPDDRTQLSVFCNNVTDIDYFTSSVDLTNTLGIGGRYYGSPRFIGGEIRYRWENPGFMDL